ncbi:MAG: phosphate ABC transporter permease PstA [Alphaproteobacteria bacterium]|nr:phosphate ABC transporter permease PstA [Alphaproteobacteria bacterium]
MILGVLALILWNGAATFWPRPIERVELRSGHTLAGEPIRSERFRPAGSAAESRRTLYRVGNYDLYGDEFRWVDEAEIGRRDRPGDLVLIERLEWGVFIGRLVGAETAGRALDPADAEAFAAVHAEARRRWRGMRALERDAIAEVNRRIERERLDLRRLELRHGAGSAIVRAAADAAESRLVHWRAEHGRLSERLERLRSEDARDTARVVESGGREVALKLSAIVRFYPANALGPLGAIRVYLSRWAEFLSEEPREANTEGGVWPAIFGTLAMTVLLSLLVAPLGVMTALYLREYARQGRAVAAVRIAVNNLAGVPSIVYGVFGLGFFAYLAGGTIDALGFAESLPNPTFGTGGLLWASLTLAMLTVPVVIVATEEALASVPRSMREGSLACGASQWQTIRRIVLPRAMPGILTGLILAMARGAGEVAPLMLTGVVKLAPELPIDASFPYLHLERSFMHLGFHIFDVGFQSRNSEAAKPMVFVAALVLILLVAALNALAILIRARLAARFRGGQF